LRSLLGTVLGFAGIRLWWKTGRFYHRAGALAALSSIDLYYYICRIFSAFAVYTVFDNAVSWDATLAALGASPQTCVFCFTPASPAPLLHLPPLPSASRAYGGSAILRLILNLSGTARVSLRLYLCVYGVVT
jgi:hypothetical protein